MKRIAILWATFFGIGRIPLAPGTWASLLTALIAYAVVPHLRFAWTLPMAALLVFLTGIPAAAILERHIARKDPRPCVIDEVAGQLVALTLVPHTPALYLAAFLLFRLFDIVKPFPVKQSERAPHGIGIMADDVLAGLYAFACLHLFRYLVLHQPLPLT